ncbi:MAG TPA: hypothetical protein DCQ06_05040 [Myxococcales bacterium]|nr:hypothetical protein [Myxococcales bacterium]
MLTTVDVLGFVDRIEQPLSLVFFTQDDGFASLIELVIVAVALGRTSSISTARLNSSLRLTPSGCLTILDVRNNLGSLSLREGPFSNKNSDLRRA